MDDKSRFTIEILGANHDHPAVVDRAIGCTSYFDEAKRIGQHLLSVADKEGQPQGYRILSDGREIYVWHRGDDDQVPR
jgi:hypothetical protein